MLLERFSLEITILDSICYPFILLLCCITLYFCLSWSGRLAVPDKAIMLQLNIVLSWQHYNYNNQSCAAGGKRGSTNDKKEGLWTRSWVSGRGQHASKRTRGTSASTLQWTLALCVARCRDAVSVTRAHSRSQRKLSVTRCVCRKELLQLGRKNAYIYDMQDFSSGYHGGYDFLFLRAGGEPQHSWADPTTAALEPVSSSTQGPAETTGRSCVPG